jgi:transcriptional regulator with XRE-family HTH domain
MTQEALGAEIGCSKQNVSSWENGRHEPSPVQLAKIAMLTRLALPEELSPSVKQQPEDDIRDFSHKGESLHSRICRLRTAKGMSQWDLAVKCGLKSLQAVQQWEKEGSAGPARKRIAILAEALGVSANELMFGADAQTQSSTLALLEYSGHIQVETIGSRIKDALKEKGLSQSQLAGLCKVTDNAVSKWIKTGQVGKENIGAVCQVLDLEPVMFLGGRFAESEEAASCRGTAQLQSDFATQPECEQRGKKDAKITEVHREEARRLRDIYDQVRADRGRCMPSQAEIGSKHKIGNQSMVSHLFAGRSALTLSAAASLAKELGCMIDDFSPRLAAEQKRISESLMDGQGLRGSAAEIADALRRSVRAIAAQWNIAPEDLLDPSPDARERVERAISRCNARWRKGR